MYGSKKMVYRYAHAALSNMSSDYEGLANVFCLCAYSLMMTEQLTS